METNIKEEERNTLKTIRTTTATTTPLNYQNQKIMGEEWTKTLTNYN